jgi:hypothetical protein
MLVAYGLSVGILIAPVSTDLLLAPLAGIALIGLGLTLTSVISLRRSEQRIVRQTRDVTPESLRERIESLEPRKRELTPTESEQLQALLSTYAAVRTAPTGPSGAQTFGHAVTTLAIHALTFFLVVMSEVYAERLLDQLLPRVLHEVRPEALVSAGTARGSVRLEEACASWSCLAEVSVSSLAPPL